MAGQRLLEAGLILGFVLRGAHGQTQNIGPKLPGDGEYCVDLEALGMSEGKLTPEYEKTETPSGQAGETTYKLLIKDEKASQLLITPQLQLAKYNLLYKPLIKFNGQPVDYSPLETIQIPVRLNDTIGELREQVTLEIVDPKPAAMFTTQREHKYIINIVQKPDIEDIVKPHDISVYDQDGNKIEADPPFNPHDVGSDVQFMIPEEATMIRVTAECPPEASAVSYGGKQQALGSQYETELDTPSKSVLVQCQYQNERWTDNSIIDRTYVITLIRNPKRAKLAKTKVDMLIWPPENGNCEHQNAGTNKASFKCGTRSSDEADVIVTYDNKKALLELKDVTDNIAYRLYNGLPTPIPLNKNYELQLKAGDREPFIIPVSFSKKAMCNTLKCPPRYELLPPRQANAITCKWEKCTVENDRDRCCQHHRAKCDTQKCPAGVMVRKCASMLLCTWDPCTKEDEKKCCEDAEEPLRYCSKKFIKEWKKTIGGGVLKIVEEAEPHWPADRVRDAANRIEKGGIKNKPELRHSLLHDTLNDRLRKADQKPFSQSTISDLKVALSAFHCDVFKCPEGFELKPKPETINCIKQPCDAVVDKPNCCEELMYCDLMECPRGYTQRFNAMLFPCKTSQCTVKNDLQRCCMEVSYCDTFMCPGGFVARPNQKLIGCAGNPCQIGDTSTCCSMKGMCDTFTCPPGTYLDEKAYITQCVGFERQVCDSPIDEFFCCNKEKSCEGFVCPTGWSIKNGSQNLNCKGNACEDSDRPICCDVIDPFNVGEIGLVAKRGDGMCSLHHSDFNCQAAKKELHLTVVLNFKHAVQPGIFIGGGLGNVAIHGKTALLSVPPIEVADKKRRHEYTMTAHVPGHRDVQHSLKIYVSPAKKEGEDSEGSKAEVVERKLSSHEEQTVVSV